MWAYRISGRRVYSLASKDWSEEERGLLDNPRPTTDPFLKELHEGEMQMSHLHLQSYEKKTCYGNQAMHQLQQSFTVCYCSTSAVHYRSIERGKRLSRTREDVAKLTCKTEDGHLQQRATILNMPSHLKCNHQHASAWIWKDKKWVIPIMHRHTNSICR